MNSFVEQGTEAPQETQTSARPSLSLPREARPVHILFLIDQFYGPVAGAENALLNIIRLLPRAKYRSSVGTLLDTRAQLKNPSSLPCPVYFFPLRRSYDWNAVKMALRLRRFIRSEQVDIVHTFFETSDLWGGLVARLSGCSVLVSSRRDMGFQRSTKHQLAYRLINPMFDCVLAVAESVRMFCIQSDGLDPSKVVTIHNGIDAEKWKRANGAPGLSEILGVQRATGLVCTVANVRWVKGIDTLIRAAAIVCRQVPGTIFLVVGGVHEQDYFQQLKELATSLRVTSNLRFLGRSDEVPSLLKMSNVFCLPSRTEGFSNALLEAMACGLPCVATRVGGNDEAVEENCSGFLIESEDYQTMANRILFLLQHPEWAKQMGQAGRAIVEAKFTAQAMVNQLINLYDTLLDRRRR